MEVLVLVFILHRVGVLDTRFKSHLHVEYRDIFF